MKSFTYAQQKWAMTGCLLLALGFSVSLPHKEAAFASLDLASNAQSVDTEDADIEYLLDGAEKKQEVPKVDFKRSKIKTKTGRADVTYVKTGQDRTQAIINVTQGSICTTCETSFELETDVTKDIRDLNLALWKKIAASNKRASADKVRSVPVRTSAEGNDEELDLTDKILAAIEKKCEAKKTKADKLECYADNFETTLEKKRDLDSTKVANFFKKRVANLVIAQIGLARKTVSKARRSSDQETANELAREATEMLDPVEKLFASIPGEEYKAARDVLLTAQKLAIQNEVIDLKNTYDSAKRSTDLQEKMMLNQESDIKKRDLNSLMTELRERMHTGLGTALDADLIDQNAFNSYNLNFQSYTNRIVSSIANLETLQVNRLPVADTTNINDVINGNNGRGNGRGSSNSGGSISVGTNGVGATNNVGTLNASGNSNNSNLDISGLGRVGNGNLSADQRIAELQRQIDLLRGGNYDGSENSFGQQRPMTQQERDAQAGLRGGNVQNRN